MILLGYIGLEIFLYKVFAKPNDWELVYPDFDIYDRYKWNEGSKVIMGESRTIYTLYYSKFRNKYKISCEGFEPDYGFKNGPGYFRCLKEQAKCEQDDKSTKTSK